MLLTMLQAYEDDHDHMPNEERLDKVDESMANLEEVVRERNRAYYDLEVGDWRGEQACDDSIRFSRPCSAYICQLLVHAHSDLWSLHVINSLNFHGIIVS